MGRALLPVLLAWTVAAGGACGDHAVPAASATAPAAAAGGRDVELGGLADDLMVRARALEPSVSAELGTLAGEIGGRLAGFEHRLKERDSILRKMREELRDHPAWKPGDVVIGDSLRYTIEVGDSPPGHHAESIRAVLIRLEAAGHRVGEVKNYWPRGDNYSGVNSVLIAPDGLTWELQFHTPESFRIKSRDHGLYEELRAEGTSSARKRELYGEMAAPWNAVPVPAHVLDPGALHPSERIILHSPP